MMARRTSSPLISILPLLIILPFCTEGEKGVRDGGEPVMTPFERGKILFYTRGCTDCHRVSGYGGTKGPDLTSPWERIERGYALKWIDDPKQIKPETDMIYPNLKEDEIRDIVEFLFSPKGGGGG